MDLNAQNMERALSWRSQQKSLKGRNTLRLCAGRSDDCEGWIIDRYDELIVAHHYDVGSPEANMDTLEGLFPDHAIFLKERCAGGKSFEFFANDQLQDKDYTCHEGQAQYLAHPTTEHDMGLFLDTHSARQWVQERASNWKILNLFAYTCAFGVAGGLAGAQVTNIDPNADYLQWGKQNAALNGIDFRNLKDTTQKYLKRHVRRVSEGKDQSYDLIITDPPAFLVGRGDDRLGRKIWPSMLKHMEDSGAANFLLICNDRSFLSSRPWHPYIHEHLQCSIQISDIPQSLDIIGPKRQGEVMDPHYHPPQITWVKRLDAR